MSLIIHSVTGLNGWTSRVTKKQMATSATSSAAVVGGEGETVCYVPASALQGVLRYKQVTVDGQDLELAPSVLEPQVVSTDMDVYVILAGGLSVGDVVYPIPLAQPLESGVYTGQLLTETMSPMSLFFN